MLSPAEPFSWSVQARGNYNDKLQGTEVTLYNRGTYSIPNNNQTIPTGKCIIIDLQLHGTTTTLCAFVEACGSDRNHYFSKFLTSTSHF